MSKEQIGEMAKVLKDYTKQHRIMASHAILEDYAEALYNEGYRKQSEGEWVVKEFPLSMAKKVTCSCCGYAENRGPAWDISWGMYNFCPNCGARMSGGQNE